MTKAIRWTPEQYHAYQGKQDMPGVDIDAVHRKYGNKPTNGFASKKEAARHAELVLMERGGQIKDLKVKTRYPIVVNGALICEYEDDFSYTENGQRIVEDAKGVRTPAYRLKKKLMRAVHGIDIKEV